MSIALLNQRHAKHHTVGAIVEVAGSLDVVKYQVTCPRCIAAGLIRKEDACSDSRRIYSAPDLERTSMPFRAGDTSTGRT